MAKENKTYSFFDQKKLSKSSKLALILSVIFHLCFLVVHFDKSSDRIFKVPPQKKVVYQVDLVPPKAPVKKVIRKKQIVNSHDVGFDQKPNDERFLGKKNQKVDRETRSRIVDKFKDAGKGEEKAKGKQIVKKEEKVAKKSPPQEKKLSLSNLGTGFSQELKKFRPKKLAAKGKKNGAIGKTGLASSNDFIEDIPLGDMTKLNTVEYKFFGFYNRIRQKLEQYWGNSLRDKANQLYQQGRNLATQENYITSLAITIDRKGNIVNIKLLGSSGVSELDDAAVESFNRAGPFPNPPRDMLKDGRTTIEWGFVVKS